MNLLERKTDFDEKVKRHIRSITGKEIVQPVEEYYPLYTETIKDFKDMTFHEGKDYVCINFKNPEPELIEK